MHVHQSRDNRPLRLVGLGKPDGVLPNQWVRVPERSQHHFRRECLQALQRPQGMDAPLRSRGLSGQRFKQRRHG